MDYKPGGEEALSKLRHDIRNQLSNIHLALETLKYEIAEPTEDITYCLNTIQGSAHKINELIREPE
ncbi:histidine kinase dimerization/phospho-acceptor domain-containing protein [Mucilaginibacter antarcticus]|uniref:histidine kinase n=1 Tax=Mucilaginibacter antarcticus TaxID=1855725 RepID=A0ABW5XS10_9SPHI